jgi:hypothetical protein
MPKEKFTDRGCGEGSAYQHPGRRHRMPGAEKIKPADPKLAATDVLCFLFLITE